MPLTFSQCLQAAAANSEFVQQWARLRKINLPKTGLDLEIDRATGHDEAIAEQFIEDVWELIWCRLPR